ncbi:MAG: amidohydrolase family protein [Acidobacteria bacterium]|nr:amidohydrolase family protein [Acidobacteriota bacterium]
MLNDVHCHFFSAAFFEALAKQKGDATAHAAASLPKLLGWDPPGTPEELADRWIEELDIAGVKRAALIASVPGDEASVAAAIRRHPARFVGFFMVDPTKPGAADGVRRAIADQGLQCPCLFPAMHHYRLDSAEVLEVFKAAAEYRGERHTAVFVHCGVLSVGVRKKLGLPSRFDIRLGQPLDLVKAALQYPDLPLIVPHFGAGFFREVLMAADVCAGLYLDTSSSNAWIKYFPGLTLADVFRQALAILGPARLLFGTDSSFFPRGWQRAIYDEQRTALSAPGIDEWVPTFVFEENFNRVFGAA